MFSAKDGVKRRTWSLVERCNHSSLCLADFCKIMRKPRPGPNPAESRRNPLRSAERVRSQFHSLRHVADQSIILRNNFLPVPLSDDRSLWDAASGLAIALIHAERDGGWRCACRSVAAMSSGTASWGGSRPPSRPGSSPRPRPKGSITWSSASGRRRKSCGGRG
jgi:hypothetical protein